MTLRKGIITAFLIVTIFTSCRGQKEKSHLQDSNKKDKLMALGSDTTQRFMIEDDFWKLIDKARTAANNNYQIQINSLKTILMTLEANEIEKFDNTFTELLAKSYDYRLWGAAYVINGGCSDDCFHYFRQYLVGHGKNKFYETLKEPESCASWIKSEEEDNWEGLQYSALEAYRQKTGKGLPKSYQPKFELKGKPFNEETVFKQYPKLAKKFIGDQ